MEVSTNMLSNAHRGLSNSARRNTRPATLLAALAAALCLVMAVAPDAQAKALRRGDRGPSVVTVQRLLHIHADGLFGEGTVKALRKFQKAHHLTVDGLAGSSTIKALRGAGGSRSGGSAFAGARVARMQRALGIAADGKFGPGTQKAVKAFQRQHGLTADGIVGQATWQALGLNHFAKPALRRKPKTGPITGTSTPGVIARMVAAGNRIARKPYLWGGGHGSFNAEGYDCSGSVSYVLHGGGLLKTPLDSTGFESWGAAGRGRLVTIYANGGHVFMTIRGRRFDTSGVREGGSRWATSARSASGYVIRHPKGL